MSVIHHAPRAAPVLSRAIIGIAVAALAGFAPPASFAAEPELGTGLVLTANEEGGSISRIDLKTGAVRTIALPIMPHNVDVSAAAGLVFVVGLGAPAPVAAGGDGAAMTMADMPGMGKMAGMAGEDEPGGRLAILSLAVLDRGPVALVDVGHHPAHVIPDREGKRVFVTDSEADTVSVVDVAGGRIVKAIGTGRYPHGLRLSPDGRELYVANVEGGSVSVIDVPTLAEVARIPVGKAPVQVGFTPEGTRVYVSLRDEDAVAVIDRASRQVVAKIAVGRKPIQVHATPDGRFVYVANQGTPDDPDNRVSIIEVAANAVVKTLTVGAGAHGVSVSPDGRFAFVTNIEDDSVSVIDAAAQAVVRTIPVGGGPNGIAVAGGT